MSAIIIKSIFCLQTQQRVDKPYLTASVDDHPVGTVWGPRSMDKGEHRLINMCIAFETSVRIKLWESDDVGSDDELGSFVVNADERGDAEVYLPGEDLPHGAQDAHYRVSYVAVGSCEAINSPLLELNQIHLTSLRCNDAQEREDEIYLMLNDRRIWGPTRMRTGEIEPINLRENFGDILRIEIWEKDRYRSDRIGTLNVELGSIGTEPPQEQSYVFHRDRGIVGDASYTLTYVLYLNR